MIQAIFLASGPFGGCAPFAHLCRSKLLSLVVGGVFSELADQLERTVSCERPTGQAGYLPQQLSMIIRLQATGVPSVWLHVEPGAVRSFLWLSGWIAIACVAFLTTPRVPMQEDGA